MNGNLPFDAFQRELEDAFGLWAPLDAFQREQQP
jgi:hypothetical protein